MRYIKLTLQLSIRSFEVLFVFDLFAFLCFPSFVNYGVYHPSSSSFDV